MKKAKIAMVLAVCAGVVMGFTACGTPYSNVKLSDYIKVGKYKGLEVAKYKVNVTEKQINKEIQSRLKAKATTKESKSGKVKDGDTVVISYEGKIRGKTFDGGSAKGANLTIGSGQFIDGFEDGLIGASVGQTKTLHLKFPSDYSNTDVAGKNVVFTVKVDAKQVKVTPKLDADFVKENSKATTVAGYRKLVKQDLEEDEKEKGEQTQKTYLWNKVVESSEVKKDKNGKEKYPEDQVQDKMDQQKEMYVQYAKNYNMSYKDFLKQQMNTTEKAFNKQLKTYAKTLVKQDEITYYIADKEDIDVSKKEYNAYIKKTLKQYGYTEKQYEKANGESYEKTVGKDNITSAVYLEKVQDLILKNAKVVDKVKD